MYFTMYPTILESDPTKLGPYLVIQKRRLTEERGSRARLEKRKSSGNVWHTIVRKAFSKPWKLSNSCARYTIIKVILHHGICVWSLTVP